MLSAADEQAMRDVIARTLGDADTPGSLDGFWRTQWFGLDDDYEGLSAVRPYLSGQVPATDCPATAAEASGIAFYCPADDALAYDVNWLRSLYAQVGPAAPVTILGHEWGHHVAARIGTPVLDVRSELQADCYAGMYVRSLVASRLMPEDTISGSLRLIEAVADPASSDGASTWDDEGVHGTAVQRRQAFGIGYSGIDLRQCRAYDTWAEEPPLSVGGKVVLQLPPGAVATTDPDGETVISLPGGFARVLTQDRIHLPDFSAGDLLMSWITKVPGFYDQQDVSDGLLSSERWASGTGRRWSYVRRADDGASVTGVAELREDKDGTARVFIVESASGSFVGADAALSALLWGYCDPAARNRDNCPRARQVEPSPSVAPDVGEDLTEAEQALLEHIPAAIIATDTCVPTSRRGRAKSASASLTCEPPFGATVVWYESFPSRAAMRAYYTAMVGPAAGFTKECPATPGEGAWVHTARPGVTAGRVGCYVSDGDAWLVWTDEAERIAVTAMQERIDWKVFYRWWRLRAGPL